MTVNVAPSKVIPVVAYGMNSNTNETEHENAPSPPEFVMIELNGELIAPVEFPSRECSKSVLRGCDGKQVELGKLHLDDNETPTMILGNHQLKGTVEKLKESFCLMQKKYDENIEPKALDSYQIIGIVKQKYLFNSYPKVIMR